MNEQSNKEKRDFKEWIKYKINAAFDGGVGSQFVVLLVILAGVILIIGPIAALLSGNEIGEEMRNVLNHIMSWNSILKDDYTNVPYFILMIAVSVIGIAFYSTFIGIITNAIKERADELKKGHSKIYESGHVVIMGFNDSILTILKEMQLSNQNWTGNKKICIIDNKKKESMEDTISEAKICKDNVLFRNGALVEDNSMEIASVSTARTIIVNTGNDFETIRVMLALISHLKKKDVYLNEKMPSIVALMKDKGTTNAARIAAGVHHDFDQNEMTEYEKRIKILYYGDIISHMFAQACRQPGLSWIISEMFDYKGSEFYIEDVTKDNQKLDEVLLGKSLCEINEALDNSIGIGFQRGNEILINPDPNNCRFERGDKLITFAEDDNEIVLDFDRKLSDLGEPSITTMKENDIFHFLILGWNSSVPSLVDEVNKYAAKGSKLTVMSKNSSAALEDQENLSIQIDKRSCYKFDNVIDYLEKNPDVTNVVIVTDDSNKAYNYLKDNPNFTNVVIVADEIVDSKYGNKQACILLLNLREYLRDFNLEDKINVTTEITSATDQQLLAKANHNDFIVGTEIGNRMLVQIANNPKLDTVFNELLSDEGSEFYLRRFDEYVDTSKPFNFSFIQKTANNRGMLGSGKQEIVLGWIRRGTETEDTLVVMNPSTAEKHEPFKLRYENDSFENYRIVAIALD